MKASAWGGWGEPTKAKKRKPRARSQPRDLSGIALPPGQRIVLPYPPVACSPNCRDRWSGISARKAYRHECWAETLAAGIRLPADGPVRIHLDFFPPDRRSRDDDNAESSFKAGRDGIAQALRVDDARFVTSRTFHDDPRCCVVVTFIEGQDHAV